MDVETIVITIICVVAASVLTSLIVSNAVRASYQRQQIIQTLKDMENRIEDLSEELKKAKKQ